jgi:hypothetical protein
MKIGLMADQHVGSAFAMWPHEVTLSTGVRLKPHKGQVYLRKNWERIVEELPMLDAVAFVGDETDGKQPKEKGRFIIEPEPVVQVQGLLYLVEPFLKKRLKKGGKAFVLKSSHYHDEDGAAMKMFAQAIDAEKDEYGQDAPAWMLAEIGGVVFDLAHTQSMMIRYQSTPMEREGQFSDMAANRADVIVRAHTHACHWHYIEGANRLPMRLELTLPPWQLQTPFAQGSRTPNRLLSRNLGTIVLDVQRDWVSVEPHLFPHPPQRRVRVEQIDAAA